MSKSFIILVFFLCTRCLAGSCQDKPECITYNGFSIKFDSLFKNTNCAEGLKEIVLTDKHSDRIILDCYGYILSICKINECEYLFNLKSIFNHELTTILKYNLKLHVDYYSVNIDSNFCPFPKEEIIDLKVLKVRHKELLTKRYPDDNQVSILAYEVFKGCFTKEKGYINLFLRLENDFPSLLSHEYLQMKRTLIDYGYINNPLSSVDKPRAFNRIYSYMP